MIAVYRRPIACVYCHLPIEPGQAFYTSGITLSEAHHLSCHQDN